MAQFEYKLRSTSVLPSTREPLGTVKIQIPKGWDSNKPTLTRDEVYGGVIRSFTVGLIFIRDGYDIVSELHKEYGILAECYLDIYEYNNKDHEYKLQDIGKLDFSSYKITDKEGKGASVTITDTSFAQKIVGRQDVEINYNDSIDLDGNIMSDPIYIDQTILGMEVVSKGTADTIDETLSFIILEGIPPGSFWVPTINSNGQVLEAISVTAFNWTGLIADNIEQAKFLDIKTPGSVEFIGGIDFDILVSNNLGNTFNSTFTFARFRGGIGMSLVTWQSSGNGAYNNQTLDITGVYDVELDDKFYFLIRNGSPSAIENDGFINVKESSVEMIQIDKAPPTISKGALLFDCFNRSIESITGQKNTLTSNILAEGGEFHDYTIQNGFLLRNYTAEESGLSWKFKDLFQNMEKIFNIGLAINGDGTTIIRKKKDFFRDGVVLTITPEMIEADSFEKSVDTDYFYSDIEIGYAKSAYEEISGLEEYNNKSFFSTILSILNNKLDAISKIRGDGYGGEFARRLQKKDDVTEDSKYDQDLFIYNIIKELEEYKQLTTEGFSNISGIDQITTPTNLKITPGRNLRRWGWMLSAGLQKYIDSKIKFNKSDVQSDLETTLEGLTVAENQDVDYSQLEAPIFTGQKIVFNAPLAFDQMNLLKNNPYQAVKVWNPVDEVYDFGWMKEVGMETTDKDVNFELIEAKEVNEVLKFWLTNTGVSWAWNNAGGILLNNQG